MKQLIRILIIFLFTLQVSACKKQSNNPSYNDQPVIEGYLQANNMVEIKISRQIASSSNVEYTNNIDSLIVTISHADTINRLTSAGDGVYVDSSLIIKEGVEYTLNFLYNSKNVVAVTTVPYLPTNFTQSATEISVLKIDSNTTFTPGIIQINDPIYMNWTNADNTNYMVVVKNLETSPTLIRDTTNNRFQVRNFRNEPGAINTYSIRDQQFQYFGRHMLVLFHLNPDYAALYNDNSNSSQNLTNPTTNITNGLGIFTGISSDTLYIQVKEK